MSVVLLLLIVVIENYVAIIILVVICYLKELDKETCIYFLLTIDWITL